MKIRRWCGALSAALLMTTGAVVVGTAGIAGAVPITVTNTADDGNDSLRDVMENQVNDGDTVVLTAGATYVLDDCEEGPIDPDAPVTIQGNGAVIQQTCDALIFDTGEDLVIESVTLTGGNDIEGRPGGAIHSDADVITIRNSAIIGNHTCGSGGAIYLHSGDLTIVNSTIAGNTAVDSGGAIAFEGGEGGPSDGVTIVNSTISGNRAAGTGGLDLDFDEDLTLVYTTLVSNEGGVDLGNVCSDSLATDDPHSGVSAKVSSESVGNLTIHSRGGGAFSTFGTVIGLPQGGPNCFDDDQDGPIENTTSSGYNYSDDASCNLTNATDKQGAANPLLAALAANGGIGQTRLPQTGSPLINAIPIASCGGGDALAGEAVTTDQRGVTRPQETGCEIGSVEIEAPIVVPIVTPTFTG